MKSIFIFLYIILIVTISCGKNTTKNALSGDTAKVANEVPNRVSTDTDIMSFNNAKELIDGIKQGYFNISGYSIAASDKELFIYGASQAPIQSIPMPANYFYLAVAPYIEYTHQCSIHSVTGCIGELQNVHVTVRFYDDSGKLILDELYNTGANGFVDLWLPREQKNAKLEIWYNGKQALKTISTVSGSKTCETTMQLQDI